MSKNKKLPWYETGELDKNGVILSGTLETTPNLGEWSIKNQEKSIFISKFSLSVQDRKDRWNYVEIVAFGRCAYYCARALRKGDRVNISGRLRQIFRYNRFAGCYNQMSVIARLVTLLYIDPKIIEKRLAQTEKYNVLKDDIVFEIALNLGVDKILPQALRWLYLWDRKFFSRSGVWGRLYWYLYKILKLFG